MEWNERLTLGVAAMDATHREFADLVAKLQTATGPEFPALFCELVEHTRQHFEAEGKLMRTCRFPAIGEHEGEHLKVLGELSFLKARVAGGHLAMARAYVEGLPTWFASHLATMDSALAACLKAKT